MNKIIISVCSGIVEIKSAPANIDIELHDYDIQEYQPNYAYGEDILGEYMIIGLQDAE